MLAEMGDKTFRLGTVHDQYEELLQKDILLDSIENSFAASVPMCSECAFEPFCGADPVFHYATQGDVVGLKRCEMRVPGLAFPDDSNPHLDCRSRNHD